MPNELHSHQVLNISYIFHCENCRWVRDSEEKTLEKYTTKTIFWKWRRTSMRKDNHFVIFQFEIHRRAKIQVERSEQNIHFGSFHFQSGKKQQSRWHLHSCLVNGLRGKQFSERKNGKNKKHSTKCTENGDDLIEMHNSGICLNLCNVFAATLHSLHKNSSCTLFLSAISFFGCRSTSAWSELSRRVTDKNDFSLQLKCPCDRFLSINQCFCIFRLAKNEKRNDEHSSKRKQRKESLFEWKGTRQSKRMNLDGMGNEIHTSSSTNEWEMIISK